MSQNLPGAPKLNGGSIIVTAPKHRASRVKSIALKPIDDIVPLQLLERGAKSDDTIRRELGYVPSPGPAFGHYQGGKGSPVGMGPEHSDRVNHGTYVQYRQNQHYRPPAPKAPRERKPKSEASIMSGMCRDLIRASGYQGKITRDMMRLAREVITRNAQVAEYTSA